MVKKSEDLKLEDIMHKNKMEEIKFEFDCRKKVEAIKFDKNMELQRFRSAGIQRSIATKGRGYSP